MTRLRKFKRASLLLVFTAFALVAGASWFGGRAAPNAESHPPDAYPELFVDSRDCPQRGDVFESARRLEELARVRADRYTYDERDGVRAVEHYQEAEACYRAAGAADGGQRVRRARSVLTARVNTDYAAARLNLANALEQKRWPAALSEIHRLLLLTQHLAGDEYVKWLKKIIGRVAAEASSVS
jgi:hypothetical protein